MIRILCIISSFVAPIGVLCSIIAGNEPVHYRLQDLVAMSALALAQAVALMLAWRRFYQVTREKTALEEQLDSAIGVMRDFR